MPDNIAPANQFVFGQFSVVGDARRKWEDRVFAGYIQRSGQPSLLVGIVADGVGSADSGSRAAQKAIDAAHAFLTNSKGINIPELLEQAIRQANRAVDEANAQDDVNTGQTTLVIAAVYDNRCYVANVGDSRAYWVQADGKLLQITRDHTFYNVYGGDPQAANAGAVVNAIGLRDDVEVDLGFYLKSGITKEQAYRLGYTGLPLQPGDSIVLCSDGLIKSDAQGKRYATDSEIVDTLKTELEANKAAIKMVSLAEGRNPTDNVSAVTFQYVSPAMVASRKPALPPKPVRRASPLPWVLLSLLLVGLVAATVFFSPAISTAIFPMSTSTITMTVTPSPSPLPTATPTLTIGAGEARVEEVYGTGASMVNGTLLKTGDVILAGSSGMKVVVGAQEDRVTSLYWLANSAGVMNFNAFRIMPVLQKEALCLNTDVNKAEVKFDFDTNLTISVENGRMITVLAGQDIQVYCFAGNCQIDPGGAADPFKVPANHKRLYHSATLQADESTAILVAEMLEWGRHSYACIADLLPTLTPTPRPQNFEPTRTPEPKEPYGLNDFTPPTYGGNVATTGYINLSTVLWGGVALFGLAWFAFLRPAKGWFVSLGLVTTTFLMYFLTLAPTVIGFDSAELATGAYTLGIVHPTGYPLYLIIGHAFTKLPFGDVGYAVNFMSAVFGTLTVFVVFRLIDILTDNKVVGLISALLLAFSLHTWTLSVIAEVYTLHTFLLSLQLYGLVKWMKSNDLKYLYMWSIFLGLGLSNHISGLFFLPGFIFLIWFHTTIPSPKSASIRRTHVYRGSGLPENPIYGSRKRDFKIGEIGEGIDTRSHINWHVAMNLLVLIVLGLLLYVYFPVRAAQSPETDFVSRYYGVNLSSAYGIFWMVSAQAYSIFVGGYASMSEWLGQVPYFFSLLWKQSLGIGVLLGIGGILNLWKKNKNLSIGMLLMFLVYTTFYISYNVIDKNTMFLPSYLLWAVWTGFGIQYLFEKINHSHYYKLGVGVLFIGIFTVMVNNLPLVDRSRDWGISIFAQDILKNAPENAVLVADWSPSVVLEYYQIVSNQRPDLIIHNTSRYEVAAYYRAWNDTQLEKDHARILSVVEQEEMSFIRSISTHGPVIRLSSMGVSGYTLVPYGK